MRFAFFLAFVLLASFPAAAQTPVSKETANSYYANCVSGTAPSQEMSRNGQEMLCACTAARLTQFFTMEDWKAMTSTNADIARPAYNKMMVNIYAPCMAEPTRERFGARCAKTSGMNQQVCNCAADKIAFHIQNYGSSIFTNILAKNPNIQDPWAALENDPAYAAFLEKATRECLK